MNHILYVPWRLPCRPQPIFLLVQAAFLFASCLHLSSFPGRVCREINFRSHLITCSDESWMNYQYSHNITHKFSQFGRYYINATKMTACECNVHTGLSILKAWFLPRVILILVHYIFGRICIMSSGYRDSQYLETGEEMLQLFCRKVPGKFGQ